MSRQSRSLAVVLAAMLALAATSLLPMNSQAEEAGMATAATPLVAASAPTEPTVVTFDKISAGDTAWMLTSSALVLMMTVPGLALFYAGMVRKKNVLATLVQSFAITCLVTILWWLVGYSLAFTPAPPAPRASSAGLATRSSMEWCICTTRANSACRTWGLPSPRVCMRCSR